MSSRGFLKIEQRVLDRIRLISKEKDMPSELTEHYIKDLIENDFDLKTIARIEVYLGDDVLIIPTKQQWRKIKLTAINEKLKNKEL